MLTLAEFHDITAKADSRLAKLRRQFEAGETVATVQVAVRVIDRQHAEVTDLKPDVTEAELSPE